MTTAETRRIANAERIPPIVGPKAAALLDEALQLAERAHHVQREWRRISDALSLLSEDPGLGVETTTHDPNAERLDVLLEETGMTAVGDVINHVAVVLSGSSWESLGELRKRIERPAPSP